MYTLVNEYIMKGKFDFKKMSKVPGVLIPGGGGLEGKGCFCTQVPLF